MSGTTPNLPGQDGQQNDPTGVPVPPPVNMPPLPLLPWEQQNAAPGPAQPAPAPQDPAAAPGAQPILLSSPPAANGFRTVLKGQALAGHRYFDAAGDPERVIGLESLRGGAGGETRAK